MKNILGIFKNSHSDVFPYDNVLFLTPVVPRF